MFLLHFGNNINLYCYDTFCGSITIPWRWLNKAETSAMNHKLRSQFLIVATAASKWRFFNEMSTVGPEPGYPVNQGVSVLETKTWTEPFNQFFCRAEDKQLTLSLLQLRLCNNTMVPVNGTALFFRTFYKRS